MAGVRARKSRRKRNIKILRNARSKKKLIKPAIGDATLKKHWDNTKTLQQNLKGLGLAYNPNDAVKIPKVKRLKKNQTLQDNSMETEENAIVNTAVIEEFEKQAVNGKKTERHISPDEAKYFMGLMKKHGTNYKAMCRDKLNAYQHTPKQLQKKCEGLLNSTLYEKYKERFPELVTDEMDVS